MGLLDDAIREHLDLKRRHGASEEDIQRAEQEALAPARRDPATGAGVPPVEQVPPPPPGEEAETGLFDHEFPEPRGDVPPPPPPPVDEPPPVDDPVYADEYAVDPPPADPDAPEPALPPHAYEDDDDDYLAPEPAADLDPQPLPPEDQETQIRSVAEEPGAEPAPDPDVPRGPEEAPPPGTAKPHGDPALDDEDFEPDEVPADEQLGGGGRDPYRARTTILDEPLGDEPPGLADEPPAPGDLDAPAHAEPPAGGGEQDVLEETPDFLQETPEHDKLWFEQKPPRDFDFE
jgi:hypothetical protein